MMTVYWTSVEFDIVDPSAYEDCVGGFVYLFLKAFDVRGAIPKIEAAIEEEGLKINQVEFVAQYDEIPWDSEEEQIQYDSLAKDAGECDKVIWDEIFAYESRDEQGTG
ncbi:MAG: hypothetical protein GY710_22510 [Desulfobacteraceae bacterium]|nr:hypothetical protein [Desulfobacteraceae bacterium]